MAERHANACAALLEQKRENAAGNESYTSAFISTWNTRCGIAEYTRYLASNLGRDVEISVFADEAEPVREDERNVVRCWKQTWDEVISQRAMRDVVQKILACQTRSCFITVQLRICSAGRARHAD